MRLANKETELLHESEEHFRFLANMIPDIVWTALPNGYRDFYNNKFTEYTGLRPEEAEGMGWEKVIHPDDLDRTLAKWEESLKNGTPYENEYRFKKYDGTYNWFLIRAIPWRDEDGNIIKWFGTTTDINFGKLINIKLQETTENLTKTNHELSRVNDIMNHFVYIAAHDLRSPVNNMKMLFELLKEETDKQKKDELITFLETSVSRLERTIEGLLDVIKTENEEASTKTLQFATILEIVIADLSLAFPDISKHIITDFKNCPSVKYVQPYLVSIIKNLVSNAYKYQSKNRELKISITTERDEEYVKIIIADNGRGFNMDTSKDIFKAFKRLTSDGEGKGVGLFVVKNIVEKSGGKIEAYGKVDEGATFTVYLKEN